MNKITYFLLCFLFSLGLFSQEKEGKVGINTTEPKATLDVEGNLRVGKVEQSDGSFSRILTVDDDGILKSGTLDATKLLVFGEMQEEIFDGVSGSEYVKYKELKIDKDRISYKYGYPGFTVKRKGFYYVSGYIYMNIPREDHNGKGSILIFKNAYPFSQVNIAGLNEGSFSHLGDDFNQIFSGIVYCDNSDSINVKIYYNNEKKGFTLKKGHLMIMYLGDNL